MNKIKYKYLVLIIAFMLGLPVHAQNVVISEYFNSDDLSKEWTELLIIEDYVNMVNYSLIDSKLNSSNIPDSWAGGIQFNDSDIWRNLRAGTIIVIHHRGTQETDLNITDGYIEIGAENTNYFTQISYNGIWENDALNIEDFANILQIIDENGNHIHSLSHIENPGGVYNEVGSPKLSFKGVCTKEASVSVCPGKTVAEYAGGQMSNLVSMSTATTFITKGTPNKKQGSGLDNLSFWTELRQPNWINPNLTSNIKPTLIELFWNYCEDSNPSDFLQGYLVVRIKLSDIAGAEHPKNGTSYKMGDMLGTAFVVASNPNSLLKSTSDDFTFDCNDAYEYRVYAYCFNQDNLLGNSIAPSYSRGRTYLTNPYASQIIRKFRPIKPSITNLSGNDSFCAKDTVFLSVNATGGPYEYTWFLDDVEITGAKKNRLSAYQPGKYKVRITNEKACYNESDEIELIQLPTPVSVLKYSGKIITRDTTMTICEGETLTMKISGGERYEWFKDNTLLSNTTDTLFIDSEGLYYAVAINNNMDCKDTSVKVSVNLLHIAYSFDRDTLYFDLDKYTPFQEENVVITNSSSDTLKFLQIIIPPGGGIYSLSAPSPAEVIEPYSDKTYRVRFAPDKAGEFIDSITFILPCNNSLKIVYLFGSKEAMNVVAQPKMINFKDKIFCDTLTEVISVAITNNEDFPVEIQTPVVPSGFKIPSPGFPLNLEAGLFKVITIELNTNQPGIYSGTVVLPFIGNGIKDMLSFDVEGKVFDLNYTVEKNGLLLDSIGFPELIGCDDSASTTIQIINTGEAEIKIDCNILSGLYLPQLPVTVNVGDTAYIEIIFVPESEGNYNEKIILKSSPCNIEFPISVYGSKNGITYGLSKRNILFDNVINCKDSGSVSQTIDLKISGDSQEKPKISIVTGPKSSVFTHNFISGIDLEDSTHYTVTFNSAPAGEYYDTIKIRLQPCDIERIIPIYGNRINPIFSLSSDTLFFGNVEIETLETAFISISNHSSVDLIIDSIVTVANPFKILNQIPILIQPDSSIDVYFEYAPLIVQNDTLVLKVYENQPCKYMKELVLIGFAEEHKIINIQINSENSYISEVGKEVDVNYYIKSLDSRTLSEAMIDSISISLKFNPTVLFPKSVIPGNAIANAGPVIGFNEITPGLLNIECKLLNSNNIINGKVFTIKYLTLLGNSLKTNIDISDYYINSKIRLLVDTVNTYLEVTDDCNLTERLINYNNFNVFLNKSITDGLIDFTIEIEEDFLLSINIYNSLGQKQQLLGDITVSKGTHQYSYNISDLPKGVYILQIGNQLSIKTYKILLVD